VWSVAHPDRVRAVHRGYLDAGSEIILTNTFGGSRFRLAMHNLQGQVAHLNRTAAVILRAEVDAAGTGALVAGDIGPSGEILAPLGTLEYADAVTGFAEQAAALVGGGVDVIWIETMSALEEMHAAIEGVRQVSPDIPLITTMTFDTRGRTMMGVTPEQAHKALSEWGAAAIGGNCGNGSDELLAVVKKMHAVASPDAVLVAKSNAGMPKLVNGKAAYQCEPQEMAGYSQQVREAGARIIGGCCGSTPAHLKAMAEALGVA
jgi:5-methyltetrahydrofolate--homocysteine methyltransferase